MTTIIIVDKTGNLKELKLREYDPEQLYKKCGYRKNVDFEKKTIWEVNLNGKEMNIELWGKEVGKANNENKYDFPPPVDNNLFYGSCALVRFKKDSVKDLSKELWEKVYEHLFGGFEDLNQMEEDDEDEEDELDSIPKSMKTKAGYLKDGFVVDNSDDGEIVNESDMESEEEDDEDVLEDDSNNEETDESSCDMTDSEDDLNDMSGSELEEDEYYYSSDE